MAEYMFGVEKGNSKVYQIGRAKLKIELGTDTFNCVATQVQIEITRQLQPIPTIGDGIHWAAQPASGAARIDTIFTTDTSLVTKFGAGGACDKATLVFTLTDALCPSTTTDKNGKTSTDQKVPKITIADAYCSSINFQMTAQQGYIGMGFAAQFTAMKIEDTNPESTST